MSSPYTNGLVIDDWGYYLLPPSHPASPGASGLVVAIRDKPTGKHFDPERILLRVVGTQGKPERITLERKPPPALNSRLSFGYVTLLDRRNKRVEFFTFGGSIEVAPMAEQTVYTLRSPAPILQLLPNMQSLPNQFVSEIELRFCELHACMAAQDSEFEGHIAALEPKTLYAAVLRDMFKKYANSKAMQETFPALYKMLTREVEWQSQHSIAGDEGLALEDIVARR